MKRRKGFGALTKKRRTAIARQGGKARQEARRQAAHPCRKCGLPVEDGLDTCSFCNSDAFFHD